MIPVELHLPQDLLRDAKSLARTRDITLGSLLRHALKTELGRAKPKTRTCADEALVARLQRLLATDIASATSWQDLERLLARKGFRLMPAGGGLVLTDTKGRRLCKSSELGFGYARLVRRFHAPMPGHPHKRQHLLADAPPPSEEDDGAFDVIERISPFSELRARAARQSAPR